MQVVVRSL